MQGQVCLVTGGAGGIGWAICRALAARGAQVYASDVSTENIDSASQEAAAQAWGDHIRLAHCDVADREAVESWIGDVFNATGRIDVLVNNAAFVRWDDVSAMPVEEMQQTMRVGYDAILFTVKAVLPKMQLAGRGQIINIGSVAGRMFLFGGYAAYAASKAAIAAYSRILQIELRASPVTVTLVEPGLVAGTDLFRRHVDPARLPRICDFLPVATPDRVAQAVLRAIRRRRSVVTIPWFNHVLSACYAFSPTLSRWVSRQGRSGRRKYG